MKAKLNRKANAITSKQLVHFEYEDVVARNVCIAGSFNDWHPTASEMLNMASGKWVKDLELAPGTYEYRFVVDGKWVTDHRCAHTVPNAFGELNSLLIVPEPRSNARTPAQESSCGRAGLRRCSLDERRRIGKCRASAGRAGQGHSRRRRKPRDD